jgi:ankyrin repeat protein
MKPNSPSFSIVRLVPTCDLSLQISEHRLENRRGVAKVSRSLGLKEGASGVSIGSEFNWLSTDEIVQLAKGHELTTPRGEVEAPGRLRMLGGYEDHRLVMVMLEFLPHEPVAHGMPFLSWYHLRFPDHSCYLHKSRNEAWWIHFHALWAQEAQPCPTLAADDALLCSAVLNNHEHWVEAILACQPRIEVPPGTQKSITETALGIAMENTGMFGADPGFMCGCHRHYRDDDFTQAEDTGTWITRAERIAARLKAAGAIDYSPLLKACRAGRTDEVESMLKQGFPPNFTIYGHTTALCEAVQSGHEEVCDLLLCHGADPRLPRPFETSMVFGGAIYPLTLAIPHPAILKRLLHAGADPNQRCDDWHETPVVMVGGFDSRDHAEEIFALVDLAVIRGKHGRSAVFYLDARNLEFCRGLISVERLNQCDERGMTPLLHAILFEDVPKAQALIEAGADPARPGMIWQDEANSVLRFDCSGLIRTQFISPIQAALLTGSLDLVEYLLDHGATPGRHSIGLNVPQFGDEEEAIHVRDRLQTDLDRIGCAMRLTPSNCDSLRIHNPHPSHCEILLATLLLQQPDAMIHRYGEFVEPIDLVTAAKSQGLHPAAIEPFRSGQKFSKAGWMSLLDEAIARLQGETEAFAASLHPAPLQEDNCADTGDLLALLCHAEQTLIAATLRITGKHLKPLHLAAEVCARASGDFKGGTARAYRDAGTTGKVSAEDFVEALAEHFKPGSTMDHGKLLHAVRLVTTRLEKHVTKLRKSI